MTYPYSLRQRLTAAVTVIGTGAGTLALLAGMPWVLWKTAGVPWPERLYSWQDLGDRLIQPISDPLMIELLALAGWVCWGAFVCSVVRETFWYATHLPQLVRDRSTHHDHLATLSTKGTLAALCVGTLMVALVALWRPETASAQQPLSSGQLKAQIAATAPLRAVPDLPDAPQSEHHLEVADAPRIIEYTVAEGDTLWDIARERMGDPLKWPRIYKLNKDRAQPDGGRLTDPDVIRPGWRLAVPVSHAAAPPPPTRSEPPAPPLPDAEPVEPATPAAPTRTPAPGQEERSSGPARSGNATRDDQGTHQTVQGPVAIGIGEASLIGITGAAGLLTALRCLRVHQRRVRSRRPASDVVETSLTPVVEKAVQAAREAALPRTPPDPDSLVTRCAPPEPPQPAGVVTIGRSAGSEVPLDVLATAGGCAWKGPGAEAAARALLTGVLTAAERQRPNHPRVRAVVPRDLVDQLLPGLPPEFTALTTASDTSQVIRLAEEHLIAHARHRQKVHELQPGALEADQDSGPGTLVVVIAPDTAHAGRLEALAARSRPGTLTVLSLGALPRSTEWHIANDGSVTTPIGSSEFPDGLELFHLSPQAGRDVLEVLLGAHGQRPCLRVVPGAHEADSSEDTIGPAADQDALGEPAPVARADPAESPAARPLQRKPVRLHVLGPVALYARGNPEPVGSHLRAEVREFLALLAAHPAGLLATDIARNLRLAGDSDDTARELKNLRRAVRRALRTATGIPQAEFIRLHGELHKFNPDLLETDLADYDQALKLADGAQENERLAALQQALQHYRGPFAHDGDYPWADGIREHLASKTADAVAALAHHVEHTGNAHHREAVLPLLEHVIALHPDNEQLCQHAIRLHQAAGRQDAARRIYRRLQRHLAELGLEPDPAIQALLPVRSRTESR